MNRCLSCGKEINKGENIHLLCARKLFGVSYIPKINFSLSEVTIKAQEMAGKLSISGVQSKLSMKLDKKTKELKSVAEGGEYILKPQINTFPEIPQNENLCMTIADMMRIDTPGHSLLKLKDESWTYVVKRFDRVDGKKIHQEDFCQILEKTTEDKYSGSIEQIANKLIEISEIPGLDVQHLYERVLLFFIIGNGDAHLKNFSVNYTNINNIRLSPVYDIVSSKLVIPKEEDCALTINGKKNKLNIDDFMSFSEKFKIPKKITDKIISKKELIIKLIRDSQIGEDYKSKLVDIVLERCSRLCIPKI